MAEHRVAMLGAALRGRTLPDRSRDPRLRALEDRLAHLQLAPDPDPAFRAELRTQLVAVAPRLVAEGSPVDAEATGKHRSGATRTASATSPARHSDAPVRRLPVMRTLRVATAALAVCALLLGGAFWMSRDSLPGDNLYGLKRAGERVELSFASSPTERAQDQLDFARERVDEVLHLWTNARSSATGRGPMAGAGANSAAARLIVDTLHDADADLTSAASALNREAVRTRSTGPLNTMTAWAPAQSTELGGIKSAMTNAHSDLVPKVAASAGLVQQAVARAQQLRTSLNCSCTKAARTDKLGPVPCTPCTTSGTPSGPSGGHSGTGGSTGTGGTGHRGGTGGNGGTGGPGSTARSGSTGAPPTTSSRTGSAPRTSTPGVPKLPLPSVPVKVGTSTCVSVSVGPIGVGVGCPSG